MRYRECAKNSKVISDEGEVRECVFTEASAIGLLVQAKNVVACHDAPCRPIPA